MESFEKAEKMAMSSRGSELPQKIAGIVEKIVAAKKAGDMKTLLKHHKALDTALHNFVGEEGKTKDEK